jgi:hypothetical protein
MDVSTRQFRAGRSCPVSLRCLARIVSLQLIVMITLSAILAALAASPAPAECIDYGSYLHWVNTLSPPGHPYRVAINEKVGYVASEDGGLSILDVNVPESTTVTSVLPGMYASDVDAAGSYAYVADFGVGLRVVDVHDPANPAIVGTCILANIASVTIAGNYAFVTEPVLQTFYVIDISDPTRPVFVAGPLNMPDFPWDTSVQGDFAYVACSYAGIAVVDIRDVKDPQVVEVANTPGVAYSVATDPNHAYVADGGSGFTVLKITDPYHVTVVGNLDTPETRDVKLSGSYAIVSDISDGVLSIDISVPELPRLAGSQRVGYQADGLAVAGSLALVADGYALMVIDLAVRPEPVPPVGGIDEGLVNVRGVDVRGTYAYVALNYGGIQVVDVADPTTPTIVGTCTASGISLALMLDESGQRAAVAAAYSGLHLFDVSDPAHPVRLGGVDTPGCAWDVVQSGAYAYIADGIAGIQIVQISNPATPVRVGSLNLPGSGLCLHVALAGNYLYATDDQAGLFVVDVSNPATPVLVRAVAIPEGCVGIILSGNYAYVSGDADMTPDSLWVVDISNPVSAFLVGGVPLPDDGGDLTVDNGTLYVSTEYWGVYVYSIEEPEAPRIVGGVQVPGYADGITVSDGRVFVVTQTWFLVLPTYCPPPAAAPETEWGGRAGERPLSAVPNPTIGRTKVRFDLPAPCAPDIEILDVAGRFVRRLTAGSRPQGPQHVDWDGRDDAGRPVPSGAYFVRIVGAGCSATERIVVIR